MARAHYSSTLSSLRVRVRMQTKGGERTVVEQAAVTPEESKPTAAESEMPDAAGPALRLKITSRVEEVRRALAGATKDPTVTVDLYDIWGLQTTGHKDRPMLKVQASRRRACCGLLR